MNRQNIAPQAFIERVRPLLDGMYHCALLITDNAEAAEGALQQALLQVYLEGELHDKRALREQLRRAVRSCAMETLRDMPLTDAERGDWHGAGGTAVVEDPVLSALLSRFQMEEKELQRYLLLRYGLSLPPARAAQAAGMSAEQAKEAAARFRARAAGARPEAFERSLEKMCRRLLEGGAVAPDMSSVCRAFERDAVLSKRGRRKKRNFPAYVLCAVGVFLCMLLFWLVAVLLQPETAFPSAGSLSAVLRALG